MEAFISGAWRNITRAEAQISGGWRTINRGEAYINGAWRTILSFAKPLTLSVYPNPVSGYRAMSRPGSATVIAGPVTATPAGGIAPYRYAWSVTSGLVNIASPTMASTNLTMIVPRDSTGSGSVSVTCTDARGISASVSVSATFTNETVSGGLE